MCVKPGVECGIPHEFGSTGFGVVQAILEALAFLDKNIKDISVAIPGFGNVGTFAASLLDQQGAKIIAISDSSGTTYNPKGLNVQKVFDVKREKGTVADNPDGERLKGEEINTLNADILIPAALGGVINA